MSPSLLLLLGGCGPAALMVSEDPLGTVTATVTETHPEWLVGIDVDFDWGAGQSTDYDLSAVVTVSPWAFVLNPGGETIEETKIDECEFDVLDPTTSDHEPYPVVEGLDVGSSVFLTIGKARLEIPGVDDKTGRHYVLTTHGTVEDFTFPASVALEIPGNGASMVPPTVFAEAAWVPIPFVWLGPTDLAGGENPTVASAEDIDLVWEGTEATDEMGFTVWFNNCGTDPAEGEFWEQISCPVTDDGAYTLKSDLQEAMSLVEGATYRTVILERYAMFAGDIIDDDFMLSWFSTQTRRADYEPTAD